MAFDDRDDWVRFILKDLIEDKQFTTKVAEGNFNFLRTNATYKRAMELAHKRFKWVQRGLK